MRISTNLLFQRGLDSLQRSEGALNKVQQQLTRQTKILSPSDDPIANSQVMNLNNALAQNDQFMRNSISLEANLRSSESNLNGVNDSLQRARQLAAGVINGSYGAEERNAVAKELRAIEKQMFDQANARDAQGEYLFSGYQSRKQPMEYDAASQSYQYVSDQGQRNIQLTPNLKLAANEPGNKPFAPVSQRVDLEVSGGGDFVDKLNVSDRDQYINFAEANADASGNPIDLEFVFDGSGGYDVFNSADPVATRTAIGSGSITDGKVNYQGMEISLDQNNLPAADDTITLKTGEPVQRNAITLVSDLASALEGGGIDGQWQNEASWALDDLNEAMDNVVGTQAEIGARMNTMESAKTQLRDSDVVNQTARAELADVDYNEAVTELVKNETLYQASQQVFSRINQLSLFDYVN
ncbi:flagellar hook-associated protein FlgL [Idiomarina seosinensis]|uniref:flagellar hook-associated protein FlgL n=1 Tax=Idiomarina seosinensis TaxID=281739 RepID=UPI00384BDA57